jgi:hypothetical protein
VDFKPAALKQTLRFYRPDGMNMHDGWLAVESCGYADFAEAQASGTRFQEGLLIAAANQKIGVEFYLRGWEAKAINVYPGGKLEQSDPGLPLPTILSDHELKEMVGAAVESATSLTANQRVAAELLNDSFFKMSPEASFLLRVSAIEALCPQADQTDAFKTLVDSVRASIPKNTPSRDRDEIEQSLKRLAARQSVRGAYMSTNAPEPNAAGRLRRAGAEPLRASVFSDMGTQRIGRFERPPRYEPVSRRAGELHSLLTADRGARAPYLQKTACSI